jgi:hypothetical protein
MSEDTSYVSFAAKTIAPNFVTWHHHYSVGWQVHFDLGQFVDLC